MQYKIAFFTRSWGSSFFLQAGISLFHQWKMVPSIWLNTLGCTTTNSKSVPACVSRVKTWWDDLTTWDEILGGSRSWVSELNWASNSLVAWMLALKYIYLDFVFGFYSGGSGMSRWEDLLKVQPFIQQHMPLLPQCRQSIRNDSYALKIFGGRWGGLKDFYLNASLR